MRDARSWWFSAQLFGPSFLFCWLLASLLWPAAARASTLPPPTFPNTPPGYLPPGQIQAHIVQHSDFVPRWNPTDQQTLLQAGLPIPAVVVAPINVFSDPPAHLPAASPPFLAGWQPLLTLDGLPALTRPPCRLLGRSPGPRTLLLEQLRQEPFPVASEAGFLPTQWICQFPNLAQAHNVMVQFALHSEARLFPESLFVGFSTDGRIFYGRRWVTQPLGSPPPGWQLHRLFFPAYRQGPIALLWELRRPHRVSQPPDFQLANLSVERFTPPPPGCRQIDPSLPLSASSRQVSKGLNLPPYPDLAPTGMAGHVARLQESQVHWARIEFQGHPRPLPTGRGARLAYFDLKHYDTLLGLLCTGSPPIAVLALLDYALGPDDSWRRPEERALYRATFVAWADLLVRYYQDRVRAWEVWNEPDHVRTALPPTEFARLLSATAETLKAVDPTAWVVSGGLSSVSLAANDYLRQTLAALDPTQPAPFDALGIHLYPGAGPRVDGQIVRDPSYLTRNAPLQQLLETLAAAGYTGWPLWVTETGWNRAADSRAPATFACATIADSMVDGAAQAAYLPRQFDLLFNLDWEATGQPAVAKVFWYQYADVGITADEADCAESAGSSDAIVDWWYGLYSGIDAASGIFEPQPNPVACTFRAYPVPQKLKACLEGPSAGR
jgi:hypothetical protein